MIVVGGGPTGFLTALGLARAGIDVTLLEAEAGIAHSPRAMVYHAAVLDGLDQLGVLEDAERIGFLSGRLQIRVFGSGECFDFDLATVAGIEGRPKNLHLGQDKLAELALSHLQRHPNARVCFDTR
ncbi:MAG TPA: FAD-dependent oxidoreductase, partial [Ramlibacter sp.]|nr:FAD-dependent oxidoreductase [Ramlibacter sp.]